jgi:pimeloyl-ACP methyl ester carboxylesterase
MMNVRIPFHIRAILLAGAVALQASPVLAGGAAPPSRPAGHEPGVAWYEPYEYKTRDGRTISDAERGRLLVPERSDRSSGPLIELSFIRFKSTAPAPGPPIVWLAGGPSDYGSDDIEGPYLALVRAFQEVGDVIALDQRGTGLSRPRLNCPDSVIHLPLDRAVSRDEYLDAYRRAATVCDGYWRDQGVDLAAYNTVENAEDVERLRRAIGAETISLYGGSYGTHLGLAYLRRHPDKVHAAILSGVEGPDHTWKLPRNADAHFEKIARLVRADSALGSRISDLVGLMRLVRDRLRRAPVRAPLPAEEGAPAESVTVGAFDLEWANQYFLGSRSNIAQLPAIYVKMSRGDFSDLAGITRQFRDVSVGSAMYYAMDCASGATGARLKERGEEARTSLVGNAFDFPFPGICDCWTHADLDDGFREPVRAKVPTLFISGTLDGQTPVRNADEVRRGFRRGAQLIVEGASHTYTELDPPDVVRFMIGFLRGETAGDARYQAPPLEFAPIPAAAQP